MNSAMNNTHLLDVISHRDLLWIAMPWRHG